MKNKNLKLILTIVLIVVGLIAATALLNHAELIIKNVKDFKKVPDLQLNIPY